MHDMTVKTGKRAEDHEHELYEPGERSADPVEPPSYTTQKYKKDETWMQHADEEDHDHELCEPGRRSASPVGPPSYVTQKYKKGGTETQYADEEDVNNLMQKTNDEAAWYSFLKALRNRLDEMEKLERAVHIDLLLRRLDWHATDEAAGYWLGHMRGRVGEFLALLVAFRDGVEVDTEAPVPALADGIWKEAEHFLPMHAGSMRSEGKACLARGA